MNIYILGVCGVFMGSLAILARELGFHVSGADENVYPPMSNQLKSAGIDIDSEYSTKKMIDRKPDLVIIGNALSRGNPCIEYILDNNILYQSGPAWLNEFVLKDRWVLAIAGTHGKTSTASMLAWILEETGKSPGYLIGGIPENFDFSAKLGTSKYFVIEADEYDTAFFDKRSKFLHYKPNTLILNNLEFDHADIFKDLRSIQEQFHHLVRIVPSSGKIFLPFEKNLLEVIEKGCWSHLSYLSKIKDNFPFWHIENQSDDMSSFKVFYKESNSAPPQTGEINWDLIGKHNQLNGLSAIAASHHVGININDSSKALNKFRGIKRRLEKLDTIRGVNIFDDFAHHPSAISSTLHGLRSANKNGRVLAIIESRSNTMKMGHHNSTLVDSLRDADFIWWYQPDGDGFSKMDKLFSEHKNITLSNSIDIIVQKLIEESSEGDDIVIMSNGSFDGIHQKIINKMKSF